MIVDITADQEKKPERPSLVSEPSAKGFAIGLYIEHLEEASFLYEQRLGLFDDPEITWLDIDEFEQRLEAHIDALVVGEDFALDVCLQQAIEGDFGELHAAVRVFCRQDRFDLFNEVLETLDFEDKEKVRTVIDALNHELPETWKNDFVQMLTGNDLKFIPFVVEPFGYQRLSFGHHLIQALQENNSDFFSAIMWALGRLRDKSACNLLLNYLNNEDESICYAASLALLRMGESSVINGCIQHINNCQWPFIPVGLGGNQSSIPDLLKIASSDMANDVCLISLGLLGDIFAIDILIAHLENDKLAEYSAIALNLITGADFYGEIFIPEEIDEDELFEEEIEKLKKGEPLYPPGEEPGITITRLSQNQEEWQNWWNDNKSNFSSDIRYRNGKPYSPECLLENLTSEKSPRLVRQMAYEELVIRYDADFYFETDMLVSQQKKSLSEYRSWIDTNQSRFQEGKWYFEGALI